MRRCLLDTGAASDYLNRRLLVSFERAREETARGNRVGIGMPVLAELHFGVDLMIAAITRTLGDCIVVIKDSDLDAVPGWAVENWSALREESL